VEFNGQRKHVMSYLTDFLFSPERANSPVRTLSGGERNRLLLARLFALPANVLVLDEPTNDLDIDTLELLEELLQGYAGTVFLVSHDRRFLDNVVTSLICWEGDLEPGKWREYEGNVGDWQAQRARMLAAKASAASATKSAAPALASAASASTTAPAPAAAKRKLSYKEQRERDELPARIAALEAEQTAINARLADGSLYASAPQEAAALSKRHAEIDDTLLAALERQETLGQ
jgi:ATP-binding cassette subfamily F protein uup